ncbi:Gfo/Idh/MocA family oxidoreductase [Pseudochelatococcus sp. B33]
MPCEIAVVGLGLAGLAFTDAILKHPAFSLACVVEPRQEARRQAMERWGVRVYADLEQMLAAEDVPCVYLATPTDLHHAQALAILAAGRHLVMEKPMAVTLAECEAIAEAAERAGRCLVVGHSHGFDLPVRTMAEIVGSGELGPVMTMQTLCATDWVYRPRRPEELRLDLGGGVLYRQGSHQIDILTTILPETVTRVWAHLYDVDPARPTTGAFSLTLEFAGGAVGTASYNGYGHFNTVLLTRNIGEWGFPDAGAKQPPVAAADEVSAKYIRARTAIRNDAPHQPHYGLTLVSCALGTLRQAPDGIEIHRRERVDHVPLGTQNSPRALVLDEFAAVLAGRPSRHDARHGVLLGRILEAAAHSARSRMPVAL